MLKQALSVFVVALFLAACTEVPANSVTPEAIIENVDNASIRPAPAADVPQWVETEMQGIDIGMWLPPGWQADTRGGLTLVEHMGSFSTGTPTAGIMVYMFVPNLAELGSSADSHSNLAYSSLLRVVQSPEHTHGATVSVPVSFRWGTHDAAYYLFSAKNDVRGMVVAVAIPNSQRIIVANITAPAAEIERLRDLLPQLLGDMRLNRVRLDSDALTSLPAPLVFPLPPDEIRS
jgi:hypothetical protein